MTCLLPGNGGDNADPNGRDVQTPCIGALRAAVEDGTLPMQVVDAAVRRILACKLALDWTTPDPEIAVQDWSEHAAFADALADTGIEVCDPQGLLPLPEGSLFIARASGTGIGVTEGDRITESFAPLAARLLHGHSAMYHTVDELPALADACKAAPPWCLLSACVPKGRKPPLRRPHWRIKISALSQYRWQNRTH